MTQQHRTAYETMRMQADDFEKALKEALAAQNAAPLWYPGAEQRYEAFLEAHPDCDLVQPSMPDGRLYSAHLPHPHLPGWSSSPHPDSAAITPWRQPDVATGVHVPVLDLTEAARLT